MRHLTLTLFAAGCVLAAVVLAKPLLDEQLARWRNESEASTPHAAPQKGSTGDSVPRGLDWIEAKNIPIDASGDRQLLMAIAVLEQRRSVAARLQHQANVGELTFHGRGDYLQYGFGESRKTMLKLQSRHDGISSTLWQVTDGHFLWTDRLVGDHRKIDRVDLWDLRRHTSRARTDPSTLNPGQADSAPISPQLANAFGGLPMLMASLREHFVFTRPRLFQDENKRVLAILGRWRPEALASIITRLDTATTPAGTVTVESLQKQLETYLASNGLPPRVPHHVLLLLGEQDLFPYTIEYRGPNDPLARSNQPTDALYQLSGAPLARLEFVEVSFDEEIDTRKFIYVPPPEPEWLDATAAHLRRLERARTVQLAREGQGAVR